MRVDIGFIVYNDVTYPRFIGLLDELGVATQASDMSMGVACASCRVEWSTRGLKGVFADPAQLARPKHYGMLNDLFRFYRDARRVLDAPAPTEMTLDEYLADRRLRAAPSPTTSSSRSPRRCGRPRRTASARSRSTTSCASSTITGSSATAATSSGAPSAAAAARTSRRSARGSARVRSRVGDPVRRVTRDAAGVTVGPERGPAEHFDAVVMATHANTALHLLSDADRAERTALGGFEYSDNRVVVHTDAGILPERRNAWASWNIDMGTCASPGDAITMTYHMNRLQSLSGPGEINVSLNVPDGRIDPATVLLERDWSHPMYTFQTLEAQRLIGGIQGRNRTWFAGAHLGYGFHEDGCRSGYEAADAILAADLAVAPAPEREEVAA